MVNRESGGVRVLRLTNSQGHTETGPRFKVSSERLERPGIEVTTTGLEGKWLNHYTTGASGQQRKTNHITIRYFVKLPVTSDILHHLDGMSRY